MFFRFAAEGYIIRHNGRRHLLFARGEQLHILGRGKRWYIDGTFKIVKSSFYVPTTLSALFYQEGRCSQAGALIFCLDVGEEDIRLQGSLQSDEVRLTWSQCAGSCDGFVGPWKAMAAVFPNVSLIIRCSGQQPGTPHIFVCFLNFYWYFFFFFSTSLASSQKHLFKTCMNLKLHS